MAFSNTPEYIIWRQAIGLLTYASTEAHGNNLTKKYHFMSMAG